MYLFYSYLWLDLKLGISKAVIFLIRHTLSLENTEILFAMQTVYAATIILRFLCGFLTE
jgi:hypothetical protein